MKLTNSWTKWAGIVVLALGMFAMVAPRSIASQASPKYEAWLNKEVHHQLAMNPWYTVFDNLAYSVNGTEVTLGGDVTRPATRNYAVDAVKHIEGVTNVVNNITVLPPSSMDDQIRRAEYHAIFSYAGMYRYAMGTNPSIHIIVNNGHVTLVGYVDNQTDLHLATLRANMVPGVFSVTNNLRVG